MAHQFDLVVIGTGAAGQTVAHLCKRAGWSVAIVDSRRYGGTCALRGCDPKKVLVGAADVLDWTRRMAGNGVAATDAYVEWPELMRFKRTFTEPVPESVESGLDDVGIARFHGRARFVRDTTIQVGDERLDAHHVVVATGAKPRPLDIAGENYLTDSTGFMDLDRLPERIIFVGGGYISFEFAHLAVRAGAEVTILHRSARALKQFDADMVDHIVAATRDAGIRVHFDMPVTAVEWSDTEFIVHTQEAERSFRADLVVHGAGRVPEIDDLDLEAGNVARDRDGVTVNEYLQSVSNPAVYAAGDAAFYGPPLTPVAGAQGRTVATNLLDGPHETFDTTGIPTVLFTIPPLASVGLSEEEAAAQGVDVVVNHQDSAGWFSSRRVNEQHSANKVLIETDSRRIVGAHLLGHHAEEVINLFALAIRHGLTADDLKGMIYAYPTRSSDLLYML